MSPYQPVAGEEPTRESLDALPGLVLVEFGAGWCPHCQSAQPLLKEMLDAHPEVHHLKIEDGRGKPLGRSFVVRLWPTFVFQRDGRVRAQISRPSADEFRRAFDDFLR